MPTRTSPAAALALGGIGTYQRFLSPYKGFRCAHHASTGGMTCSNYGRHAILEFGLFGALPRIRERLIQCSGYATDPRKGKIGEDDPGPLACYGDPGAANATGLVTHGVLEAGACACFSLFS